METKKTKYSAESAIQLNNFYSYLFLLLVFLF